ncbi:MAG: hypothetical protein HOP18_25795 [Deltaproteobacteria bacterium]|nr:hypothetical protein [Deltaproteobacteria bacterium]
MKAKAIMTGLWGLLVFTAPTLADPPLATTEKTYRLLQTISSQLQEVQTSFTPSESTPAATALAKAREQVRIVAAHCCRDLYVAQLTAAKAALARNDRQQGLHHLRKADETLSGCPVPSDPEPEHDHQESGKEAVARR